MFPVTRIEPRRGIGVRPLRGQEPALQQPGVHQVTMPPPDLHRWTCTSNRMLEEEVLPEIQAVLGRRRWRECIWQQVPPTHRPTD